jgi:RNA-directed DNA polymerase
LTKPVTEPVKPKGKLDAMTTQAVTALDVARADGGVVNGPEDPDWDVIDWSRAETQVDRLRKRIFKASRDGDLARVRNLQKLMLRSHANTLTSVRRVTERNRGRSTPGVDGQIALTSSARARLAGQ